MFCSDDKNLVIWSPDQESDHPVIMCREVDTWVEIDYTLGVRLGLGLVRTGASFEGAGASPQVIKKKERKKENKEKREKKKKKKKERKKGTMNNVKLYYK